MVWVISNKRGHKQYDISPGELQMRVLVVTNFYPPHELGGQGRSCEQVVEGLRRRGHQVVVLTSTHGANRPIEEDSLFRALHLEMDLTPWRHGLNFFTQRKKRERANLNYFRQLSSTFKPDVVFVWGMWNLPRSLPAAIEAQFPGKVLYRFAEYWPTLPSQHEHYWRAPGRKWFVRLPKKALGSLALTLLAREQRQYPLRFEHAYCVSEATRDELVAAGVPVDHAHIIHTGLDVQAFAGVISAPRRPHKDGTRPYRLLYAGRIHPQKGLETVIEALAGLAPDKRLPPIHFDIAGSGSDDYVAQLHSLIRRHALTPNISFLGQIPAAGMPALLQQAEMLVVPSLWTEPFARIVLEGMAAGAAVVAAASGGTSEIVEDGKNGLLFSPGDSAELAQQITRLILDPDLRHSVARAGYQTVCNKFTFDIMMDKIESLLESVTFQADTDPRRRTHAI